MYEIFDELCKKHGVTPYKVCKELNISQGTISNWKNRGNNLSYSVMKKIAEYFGVSIDYLMGSDKLSWNPKTQEIEYYENEETADYAEFLHNNPEYKVLFDAIPTVKKEDIQKALRMIGILNED